MTHVMAPPLPPKFYIFFLVVVLKLPFRNTHKDRYMRTDRTLPFYVLQVLFAGARLVIHEVIGRNYLPIITYN